MSNEIAKEVLRNAIWKAADTLPLHEVQGILTETLHTLSVEYVNRENEIRELFKKPENQQKINKAVQDLLMNGKVEIMDDGDIEISQEISFEEDAKQIDDAQRYRDLKS
jgi:hypothetical protein